MKDSSDTLSLTYDEFCHIRNVITRSELETLLFDEKLYTEVAQSKVNPIKILTLFNIYSFSYVLHVEKFILIYLHLHLVFNVMFVNKKCVEIVLRKYELFYLKFF
jgi:hypothetical protein